ncbi:Type II secretory pathway ATPase GspE/PulE or T4P pilus assembly pathway ATPase PilB [Marinobacter daqiaonensis]|uniref:Type II secretory pathway ATPase GspE/PulE or T4P pilus assembly pathway ATPase PilB n=1 Tax=Marinobacter daqiaonensis TaxID=650891 RepID=A0A1I6IKR4_9GAMM|nr:ATPase, T2SS/T4P/T4SS family [Marinobacter daqiaonensis]SFR67239.1 Type II secretory pathway ATPase GspE/PulE or T4P pilus assembly pathway ATPase PilB [Marinobacter daqiaonensis]
MANRYAALFTGNQDDQDTRGQETQKRQPYRILLVDDEPNILASLRRVFMRENYELLFAKSAAEALKILEQQPVELIMTDFMMPGMNGSELLRTVREHWPRTIRIMLTGHANTDAVMGSIKDGAVYRFILKPWNDDDLRLTIALALEQYELIQKTHQLEQQNRKQGKDLETIAKLGATNRSQLAIMLHKKGWLNAQQIQQLHREMQNQKTPVVRQLLKHEWVDFKKVHQLLRDELMFEEIDLREFQADPSLLSLIPQSVCIRQLILPLRVQGKRLRLAMVDPMDINLIDELGFMTGYTVHPLLVEADQMQSKLGEIFGEQADNIDDLATKVGTDDPYEGIEIVLDDEDSESLEQLLGSSEEPPAIRLVNGIILEALRLGASDIHIHPRTKSLVVRYRIDGVLQDKIHIPTSLLMSVVSRIKVMAELDITERRRPQDGRITVKTPMRIVDLRISTLPTINGEKVVMRVLERQSSAQSLPELGLSEHNLKRLTHVVGKPQGIILATGPTGSGKTTTLYALLQHNATAERNYVTIEDPVEFHVDMAGQVPVKDRIGLDFATVLRAILRQDPDVILLGEIRDAETADVAFHAAMTGHLVYSTLHTSSAAATVARLLDLGLKPFVLASALEAIIAQRLVRRICSHCREQTEPPKEVLEQLGARFRKPDMSYFQGRGCERCHKGYRGRVALHEVLTMNEKLRIAVTEGASAMQIESIAREQGMKVLLDDALEKLEAGHTSAEEILRVLGPQELHD